MSRPPSHRGQPIQLRHAKRPRRTELRATVEKAQGRLDVALLLQKKAFDQRRPDHCEPLRDSRFSFVKRLVVDGWNNIEARHHDGHVQAIRVAWCPTGYGGILRQRPLLLCPDCGKRRRTLYFRLHRLTLLGHLACAKCTAPVPDHHPGIWSPELIRPPSITRNRRRKRVRRRITGRASSARWAMRCG